MKNFAKANKTNLLTIGAAGSIFTAVLAIATLFSEISPAIIL